MPAPAEQGIIKYDIEPIPDRYAVVFPPQGSQTVGAGLVEFEHSPAAREILERANEALGFWVSDIAMAGPQELLDYNPVTQPAMTAITAAKFATFRERNPQLPEPSMFGASSAGRYAMLVASGVLEIEDAVQLSRIRALATQKVNETVKGAMAQIVGTVGGAEERVRGYVAEVQEMFPGKVIVVSNVNTDRHITVSGEEEPVGELIRIGAKKEHRALKLPISFSSHSPLQRPASEVLLAELKKRRDRFHQPKGPLDINGLDVQDINRMIELLGTDVISEENWPKTVKHMKDLGIEAQVEFVTNPVAKDVLGKYTTQLAPEIKTVTY